MGKSVMAQRETQRRPADISARRPDLETVLLETCVPGPERAWSQLPHGADTAYSSFILLRIRSTRFKSAPFKGSAYGARSFATYHGSSVPSPLTTITSFEA